jgi:hypothetical protein
MAMGRTFQSLEQAGSWEEFQAAREREMSVEGHRLELLWIAGGLLFGAGLLASALAIQEHHWWLWLMMLVPLTIDVFLAIRALDRVDRERARTGELERLEDAWLAHLNRRSPAI